MWTIIAGSRTTADAKRLVLDGIDRSKLDITGIVSGGSGTVDLAAIEIANECFIPLKVYIADWDRYGRRAGPLRNQEMARNAQALIAIWDGKSPGTSDMIKEAQSMGLTTYILRTWGFTDEVP